MRAPDPPAPVAAILCHPHPLFGGTLHNKTLFRIAKRLADDLAVTSLRFNFRGTGESEGVHDGGDGERDDVVAALDWMETNLPAQRRVLVGYSFGAVVGLDVGIRDPRVEALVALGLPLDHDWDLSFLQALNKPACFVHGEHDEFGPGRELVRFAVGLPRKVETHVVPSADHLFHGHEDEAVHAVVDYIRRMFS